MGIKEFDHLKKSLSEIRSKSIKINRKEKSIEQMRLSEIETKMDITILEVEIKNTPNEIQRFEKKLEKKEFNQDSVNKLYSVQNEIAQISKEITTSGKVKRIQDAESIVSGNFWIILLISFIVIPFLPLGEGWMTLLISDEDAEFECDNGSIIPAYRVNNGDNDCGDNSDEDVFETEELIAAMEQSESDSDIAFFGYCCLLPIILIFLISIIGSISQSKQIVSGEIMLKLSDLNEQKKKMEREKEPYNNLKSQLYIEKRKLENTEKQLEREKSNLVKLQISLTEDEAEINKLSDEIEETYQSIKHLIPYSDYL